jgi:hypothetical protein
MLQARQDRHKTPLYSERTQYRGWSQRGSRATAPNVAISRGWSQRSVAAHSAQEARLTGGVRVAGCGLVGPRLASPLPLPVSGLFPPLGSIEHDPLGPALSEKAAFLSYPPTPTPADWTPLRTTSGRPSMRASRGSASWSSNTRCSTTWGPVGERSRHRGQPDSATPIGGRPHRGH